MSDFEKYDDILDVEFTLPIDKEFISQVKHCPVVLIVDTSSSMADKIDELNAGVEALKTALMEDDTTHDSVDIAIIEMGMGMAQLSQPFTTVSSCNVKKYSANGVTPMAGAINLAILHINQLKEEYKKRGVRYYRPWLILFSDGLPTDDEGYFDTNWKEFASILNKESNENHLICFTFYIGDNECENSDKANQIRKAKEVLYSLASKIQNIKYAYELKNELGNLKNLFQWLSASVGAIVNKEAALPAPPAVSNIQGSIFDDI